MTIGKPLFLSFLVHSLLLCGAMVFVRQMPLEERVFTVEIRESPVVNSAAEQGDKVRPYKRDHPKADAKRKVRPPIPSSQHSGRPGDSAGKAEHGEVPQDRRSPPDLRSEGEISDKQEAHPAGLREGVTLVTSEGGQGAPQVAKASGGRGEGPALSSLHQTGGSNQDLLGQLRASIEKALIYPPLARKRKLEGTVLVHFRINGNGTPLDVRVIKSSNYAILDEEAIRTVIRAAPLPSIGGGVELPIRFRLLTGP
jgi:TonB family protein